MNVNNNIEIKKYEKITNKKDKKRVIEVLKNYNENLRVIEKYKELIDYLEKDISDGNLPIMQLNEPVQTSIVSSPLENHIIRVHSKIEFLENKINVLQKENKYMETALDTLPKELSKIIELRYIKSMQPIEIADIEHISCSTYYRLHNKAINELSYLL